MELVKEKDTKEPFEANRSWLARSRCTVPGLLLGSSGAVAAKVVQHALERGLIVRALPNDVVAICPPLIAAWLHGIERIRAAHATHEAACAPKVSPAEIDEIFDRLEGSLTDAAEGLAIGR